LRASYHSVHERLASQGELKKISLRKLSKSCYAFIAEGDPNTGVIVGDDGVMVIDAQATPLMAREVTGATRSCGCLRSGVRLSGDLVEYEAEIYTGNAHLGLWPQTLERLRLLKPKAPGPGSRPGAHESGGLRPGDSIHPEFHLRGLRSARPPPGGPGKSLKEVYDEMAWGANKGKTAVKAGKTVKAGCKK
jgi:hypothetical protein